MKILLFAYTDGLQKFYDHFYRWCVSNLPSDKIDVKFIVGQNMFNQINEHQELKNLHPISLTSEDFNYIFQNNISSILEQLKILYKHDLTIEQQLRFKEVLKIKLGDWEPSIVITVGNESAYYIFHKIYPNSLCLSQENGIFSRPPFMRTMSYDPSHPIVNVFFERFVNKIINYKVTEKENNIINKFKSDLQDIIEQNSPISDILLKYRDKFRKLILLPLLSDSINERFNKSYFLHDFDFVEYVMNNVPSDVGVCVTEHDEGGIMHGETLEYFRKKYPNFIFLEKTANKKGQISANSLHYFAHVDAVINTTSKTGLTAVLWDKPIISMAEGYNDWIKDMDRLDDKERLNEVLNMGKSVKNNVLCWYFENYVIFEKDFYKEGFLWNYLNTKLEKFRKDGITFEYFEKINDLNDIFPYVINYVKNYYKNSKNTPTKEENYLMEIENLKRINNEQIKEIRVLKSKLYDMTSKKNFLEQIFSLRNDSDHKVIRILGIKIKTKRKLK